jgi:hypothetical protein
MQRTWQKHEMHIVPYSESPKLNLRVDGNVILKLLLREWGVRLWAGSFRLVEGPYEHDSEPLDFLKGGECPY